MKSDPFSFFNAPPVPPRKWYQREEKREVFIHLTPAMVVEHMKRNLLKGTFEERSFWSRPSKFSGDITGNQLNLLIGTPETRGTLDYRVFGECKSFSNGTFVQVAVRHNISLGGFLPVIVLFPAIASLLVGIIGGLIAICFYGVFFFLGTLYHYKSGLDSVVKIIYRMGVEP